MGNEFYRPRIADKVLSEKLDAMNEYLANIQYSPILDYKYARFFDEVQYNGKTLSDAERKELVVVIDETIAQYSEGLPMMYDILESTKDQQDDYHEIDRTVVLVMQFVRITTIDSMVASKYFILADGDYDRRFMRGKLMVILNEGFKRLYGFDEKTHKKSEWNRLRSLMGCFPEVINRQYYELTYHLEKHAKSSSWWKEERNLETHMDTEKLYVSRQEEIIESKVMIDSMKLFNTLLAVNHFLTNIHAGLFDFLVGKDKRGELKDE